MDAETLTRALGGRWSGGRGMASCPVPGHGKGRGDQTPSLSIGVGERQAVVLHCHAGCAQADVIAALRAKGLWPVSGEGVSRPPPIYVGKSGGTPAEGALAALARLWDRALPVCGTPAERYLRRRGLIPDAADLRYLPSCTHTESGHPGPVLVAGLRGREGALKALETTWITEGGDKVDVHPVRKALGRKAGASVQLFPAGETLGLAEGVETALSAAALFALPVWAACGTGFDRVGLPDCVREVMIFADQDAPGMAAARRAERAFRARGLRAEIRAPDEPGADWNDVLLGSLHD